MHIAAVISLEDRLVPAAEKLIDTVAILLAGTHQEECSSY